MTAEEKQANWQRAHDLHFLRYRSGLSLVELGEALGVGGKALRKMELNSRTISEDFMRSAAQVVESYRRSCVPAAEIRTST
jgi:transcriptional regulator with XRE-family HTH domain